MLLPSFVQLETSFFVQLGYVVVFELCMLLNQQLQESKVLYGSTSKRLKSDKVLDVLQENRINMAVFSCFLPIIFSIICIILGFCVCIISC
ncbi:hypothetical protein [Gossypium barbadense]|uniref:Uncharacterized protein n=1 Tax=Gossypium barbadense TaxID=3634 RepID=A0A5J5NEM2_GOSBA|nr:hypothetical protein [Gossypium barbadense]